MGHYTYRPCPQCGERVPVLRFTDITREVGP